MHLGEDGGNGEPVNTQPTSNGDATTIPMPEA